MIQIKAADGDGWPSRPVRHFIFRCPVTGLNIQGTLQSAETEAHYVAHACPACGGMHLVNPLSGKLMSEEHPPPKREPQP